MSYTNDDQCQGKRCYKCGDYINLSWCDECKKCMCPRHQGDMIGRGIDMFREKLLGPDPNWFK